MKYVEKWLWRIRRAGGMTTTRAHFTEDEIRREHADAQRVTISRIVVELPDTEQECEPPIRKRGDH
jgi:hypothetical protein